MSIKYDSKREPLAEIIKKATINATYVIPDLQRPYVWSPRQVTMLIDSLFRGWPFGSLLLWEVKPDCFEANEGIPHRPFWQVVDRTGNDKGSQNSALGQPATYQMVLDGQQRVQSLILALGGDQWGFQLLDSEWALDLQDRRVKPSSHWSKASMCIDLQKFTAELKAKNDIVRKIEVGKILDWAILDPVSGQSAEPRPANYVHPLETAKGSPGRFIRLSRFWEMVQKDLSEDEYKKLLDPMLKEHSVSDDVRSELLGPLAVFMKVVENVKTNSFVHALQIESFELTPQWSKDDYSDAIVNIFTRLNTAGRTLTREEITLAWLKVGWLPEKTDNKTAGQCLEELRAALGDRGFRLETDEIVRLISFVWAVEFRVGTLLDSKDLLKGDIVRSMAASVAAAWTKLKPRAESCAELIKERDLLENQGSFNAIIVYLTWYRLAFDRFDAVAANVSVIERDSLEKQLHQRATQFLDRWIFGSQWANVWGDGAVLNFQNFATELHAIFIKFSTAQAADLITTVDDSISQMMARVSTKAIEQINNVLVRDRRRVHAYYPFLWVWHRLDDGRWKNSSIQMRTGRKRTSKLEVDHTVADAWWVRLMEQQIKAKLANFTGTDAEKALIAPDNFESRDEAIAYINLLGNCSLLDKSFNISKSDESMRHFLQQVHEFKDGKVQMADWETALALTPTLTLPDASAFTDIKKAIHTRDALIRKDLIDFIAGQKHRVD
ncbi:DUF262 domain-containing protein [Ottowia sp.]|uniref:DUF262 domain-containing protein n=1 Tax=Ottowia sp. TaxID=1898956 RepID=UPI00394C47BF